MRAPVSVHRGLILILAPGPCRHEGLRLQATGVDGAVRDAATGHGLRPMDVAPGDAVSWQRCAGDTRVRAGSLRPRCASWPPSLLPARVIRGGRLSLLMVCLATACAHTPNEIPRANPACADPHDPAAGVSVDSVSAGPSAVELQFYRSATGAALAHVTAAAQQNAVGGTADSLGRLRLPMTSGGPVSLRSIRIGYRRRVIRSSSGPTRCCGFVLAWRGASSTRRDVWETSSLAAPIDL